jgi:hypothetical protein
MFASPVGSSGGRFSSHLVRTLVGHYEKAWQHQLCKNQQTEKYYKERTKRKDFSRADFA